MNKLLPLLFVLLACFACNEEDTCSINGFWQLKTIETEGVEPAKIDTVFLGFQRGAIFSYTILHERENEPSTSDILFGYIDFPTADCLHLLMDGNYDTGMMLWKDREITFDVLKLSTKQLILKNEKTVYNFEKY
ncbi:MAG: hypothetical protein LBR64_07745 [Dysgonamonadaceae bacterium]|jgi:hypothetical protein|nr:hypothetical protein [Dysgonamonadaceae bacterium]